MPSPESQPAGGEDPRLTEIMSTFGDVLVVSHGGGSMPLSMAIVECPPFAEVLLAASTPEELETIVGALKQE